MDDLDKILDENIEKIKDGINKFELSEEFKENLKKKMDYEYNKPVNQKKVANTKKIYFTKMAASFACIAIIFTTCFAFANDIENLIERVFSNTDKIVEQAIANGNYKEVNMDYVKNNGISAKIDYIIREDDCAYIAFNVLTDEKYDKVFINEYEVRNLNDEVIYSNSNFLDKKIELVVNIIEKKMTKNNYYFIFKIKDEGQNTNASIAKIIIKDIKILKNKSNKCEIILFDQNFNIET